MQSVLRPQRSDVRENNEGSRPRKRIQPRRQSLKVSPGIIAVSALGLWLIGGVAWWQLQLWTQPEGVVESHSAPVERIAGQEQQPLW